MICGMAASLPRKLTRVVKNRPQNKQKEVGGGRRGILTWQEAQKRATYNEPQQALI